MVISIVRFKSKLSPDRIQTLYDERGDQYQQAPSHSGRFALNRRPHPA